jgi:Flp pilus assembly protein TadB
MKTVTLLALASLAGLVALAGGLALGFRPGPIFALTMIALLLLIWAADYRRYPHLGAHFPSHLP